MVAEAAFNEALEHHAAGGSNLAALGTLTELSRASLLRGDHRGASERAKEVASRLSQVLAGPDTISREVLWETIPILRYAGDPAAAAGAYAYLVQLEEQAGGPKSIPLAAALQQQAEAEILLERYAVADSLYRRALAIRRSVSPSDAATGQVLLGYAQFGLTQGNRAMADTLFGAAIETFRENLASPHVWIGEAELGWGRSLIEQSRYEEAIPHLAEARANFTGAEGPGAGALAPVAIWRGGEALSKAGRFAEAEEWLREAVDMFEGSYAAGYILTANAQRTLGELLVARGKGAEALPVLTAALDVLADRWGAEDFRSDGVRVEMAHALIMLDRVDEARDLLDPAHARLQSERPEHPYAVRAREVSAALTAG